MEEQNNASPETEPTTPPVTPAPEPTPAAVGTESDKNAQNMGMLCHLLAFAGYVVPMGNIIGPLVLWLMKKDEHPFIDEQGKESVNFQISVLIVAFVLGILSFIPFVFCVTIPLLFAVVIAEIVFVILAAIAASKGEHYKYPYSFRLIK
ncbi:MAG: DUF4870 domain-containing protein [Phycisphaera sp.]|nr:DUF4870 domain-containing protein [Phycisphaera sp.]